jgi:hypothetical protein
MEGGDNEMKEKRIRSEYAENKSISDIHEGPEIIHRVEIFTHGIKISLEIIANSHKRTYRIVVDYLGMIVPDKTIKKNVKKNNSSYNYNDYYCFFSGNILEIFSYSIHC